jgi:hypothetical protein
MERLRLVRNVMMEILAMVMVVHPLALLKPLTPVSPISIKLVYALFVVMESNKDLKLVMMVRNYLNDSITQLYCKETLTMEMAAVPLVLLKMDTHALQLLQACVCQPALMVL